MRTQTRCLVLGFCGLSSLLVVASVQAEDAKKKMAPKVTYEDDVKPIFRQKCFSCHNADKKSGDLDLTNYTNLMIGGGSGEVVEPGDSGSSYLYQLVAHESEPYMPPEQPKLPDAMVETIRKWIDGGVLETKSSVAKIVKKKTVNFALKDAPTERPKIAPLPPRLPLEPVVHTKRATAATAMATSPWSPLAAIGGQGQVLLYDTKTLQLKGVLPFPEGVPQVLKFSRNGSLLLAGGGRGGQSGRAIVWNVLTGERVFEVGDELDTVLAADISSDQTLIALGGPQRVVRIYSTESGQLLHELRKHTDWIYQVEFSPDSVLLATGDRNGGLFVWEGWTGREYLTLKGHSRSITGISWRSDSNVLATGSEDAAIKLWEMENGGAIKSWSAHGGGVASIEFARDGRILSCGRDRQTKLWDQNGKALRTFEAFSDLALSVTFCDESNRAIAGDWDGNIRVWNAADGKRVGEIAANPPTLQNRVVSSQQALTAAVNAHKPLASAYATAKTAADKLAADLKARQGDLQKATAEMNKAKAAADAMTKNIQAATAAQKAAQAIVTKLGPTVPMLAEAVAKANAAAKAIPADKELTALAAKLKQSHDQHAGQLAAQKKAVAEKTKAIVTMQGELKKQQAAMATETQKMKDATAKIATMSKQVKPMTDKANAAKSAADKAAASVAAADQALKRWQSEVSFANQVKALRDQQTDADKALDTALGAAAEQADAAAKAAQAYDAAKAKATAAAKQVTDHQSKMAAINKNIVAYQTAQKTAVAQRDAAKANAAKLAPVAQLLQEAAAKAKEALAKSGNDKTVAAAAAGVDSALKAKQAELAAAQKTAVDQQKAFDQAGASLTKAQAELTQVKQLLAKAMTTAQEYAKAVGAEETKVTAAKKAASDAEQKVKAAEAAVEKIRGQLNAAKGVAAT